MESIVKDCISNITGICRICNQKIILSSDDVNDGSGVTSSHQQTMINHYLDCIDSFKSVLLNINYNSKLVDHDHQDSNISSSSRKRKKIENVSPSDPTTITSSSSNHYFKDSLFRVSMISILLHEHFNQSVMSLLMTCKDAMKWKDTVVFPSLPSIDAIELYKNNGRINQLPRRYNGVYIMNFRDREYFKENVDGLINHHCRELNYLIDEPIPAGFIPDHFTKIRVCGEIEVGSIPPFTTHLSLGLDKNQQEIYKELFPNTLEALNIINEVICKHSNLDDLLPHNISALEITYSLVQPYLFKLKKLNSLAIRNFGHKDHDNEKIEIRAGTIPNTIEHLNLRNWTFENGSIPSSLDNISKLSLTHCELKLDASQSPKNIEYFGFFSNYIRTSIPPSTKYLDYGIFHDKPKANDIPNGVTHIRFDIDQALVPRFIPDSCEYLEFPYHYNKAPLWKAIPKHLKAVSCNPCCQNISQNIPPSIKQTCANMPHQASIWADDFIFKEEDWYLEI
ncbi:hypothetical protein DFA_11315 [Cavenderia fasciculata]|uniref:FNIP repeat-containing protein n=1 Tax=Cavenderia fasciculata TaxID=261658 RepID=F4QC67_CACFS|nr:uncharacterized protein DFA_11315 [Cavenderia fasciculata]EGG13554.1 hypothetical protein DFA_11315 [Cavenderia fasciculata]|eukprot:XP_004350258.1 hypothetical protein DFA_11315 [Cavenderia fasciculata]